MLVKTPTQLLSLLAELDGHAAQALGLGVVLDPDLPKHVAEDPRRNSVLEVHLADAQTLHVVSGLDELDLTPLFAWLSRADGPYFVFHGAHETLHRLQNLAGDEHSVVPPRLGCTQSAAKLLGEGTRPARELPSLQTCVEKVLGAQTPSNATALVPLMRALTPMLRTRQLAATYQLECDIVAAVIAMERAGLAVDGAAFQRIVDAWTTERATTTDPQRVARLDKLTSTYGYWPQEYIRANRILCRLHPLATDSGRFSCTDPNLQQVPSNRTAPGLRACFAAPPGYRLIIADYAQVEMRVAAHFAGCDALRAVFVAGRDPHQATAATITGKDEDEISHHERQLAKAVNFGFLFGMGAPRFREYAKSGYGVELDADEAIEARAAFLRAYPGVASWHQRVSAMGRAGGSVTVRTLLGRRKRFAAGKFAFNAALNIPVQGTAAEGFKQAIADLHRVLPTVHARGVLSIHDEYIAEVPTQYAEQARELVVTTMRDAMAKLVTSVPIEVDAIVAPTWADKP